MDHARWKPWLLRQRRRVESVAAVLRRPPWVPPGHFYSPVSAPDDVARALTWNGPPAGVDMRVEDQMALLDVLSPFLDGFVAQRYREDNEQYGPVDAAFLQAMLRHHQPRRIIEVGSGHSTMTILDTADRFLPELELTCVEPYADRLRSLLPAGDEARIHLIEQPVQEVPLEVFEALETDDILFLDSTHVVKHGSDVVWEVLHVLPRLAPGVVVHVHDLHWPFRYPQRWLREGRDWTETYLWHAFLAHNDAWPVRLMTSWVASTRPEALPERLRHRPTGSLWVQRATSPTA